MKSKLETSIGQLYKLKNQIRVQLNQIRPNNAPKYQEKHTKSAKKLFVNKFNEITNIVNPPAEKSRAPRQKSKRLYELSNIMNPENSRLVQKKHYDRHYADNVTLENNIKHKTSAYFHIKPYNQAETDRLHNTSLSGIGMHDKSITERSMSRKRIFQNKLVFKPNFF